MDIKKALATARDAFMQAQGAVIEACAWLYCGWHLTADFIALHKHWTLIAFVALILLAVKF